MMKNKNILVFILLCVKHSNVCQKGEGRKRDQRP